MGDDFGPLLPETGWISLALVFVITAATVAVLVLGAVVAVLRYRRSRMPNVPPELPAVPPPALASRLAEIDGLLAAGRIDDAEHAAMRARILDLR